MYKRIIKINNQKIDYNIRDVYNHTCIFYAINFHPSTPKYRGAGGVNYAIYKDKPKNRKQQHKLFMPDISVIVRKAHNNGFKLVHKIGMIPASFEYHYLYIFRKI